jgi:hypothetical protein
MSLEKKCKNCQCTFDAPSDKAQFCSIPCRKEHSVIKKCQAEGLETLICRICGRQTRSIISHIKNHREWGNLDEYKKEFPGEPLEPLDIVERKRVGSANAGARMREPEHRKRLSESFKGKNNPMHSSKVSEAFRKTLSPFSSAFYVNRGHTLEEAGDLANRKKEETNKSRDESNGYWNRPQYWINKGHTEEEAKVIVSKKQSTFSKEKCIEKYGEEEGLRVWSARQEKWLATLDSKTDEEKLAILRKKIFYNKVYSKKSQDLFNKIAFFLPADEEIYFAQSKYEEKNIETISGNLLKPDFCYKNKIIEFFGSYWHCDPKHHKFGNPQFVIRRGSKKYTAESTWKIDKWRIEELIKSGYDLLVIWESEWDASQEGVVARCLEFLRKKDNE